MAWIEMVAEEDATGALGALYAQLLEPASGRVDNVLKVHSLDVDGLRAHLAVYRSAMRPTPGLSKAEREMIAVVVSGINECHY